MKSYIYYIINKVDKKRYVGQTINLEKRLYDHFYELERNQHHSHKLQRAYNQYGKENFIVEYQVVDVNSSDDLNLLEMNEIEKFNSYKEGYNETLGGEGNKNKFNYHDSVILFNILQRYEGIGRYLAKLYGCDASVFYTLRDNLIYQDEPYSEAEIQQKIKELNLSTDNLKENYVSHNTQKLTEEKCLELLSVVVHSQGYEKTMCQVFNINSKVIYRLKQNLIYKDYIAKFNEMTLDEQIKLKEITFQKYNLENIKAQRARAGTKNQLTQEQVNYILDNVKKKPKAQIARELKISPDRVSGVANGKYYKDLIANYYSSK